MSQKNTKTAAKSTGASVLAKHKHPNAAHPPRHSDNPGEAGGMTTDELDLKIKALEDRREALGFPGFFDSKESADAAAAEFFDLRDEILTLKMERWSRQAA